MEGVRIVGGWDPDCDLMEEMRVFDIACLELLLEVRGNLELHELAGFFISLAHEE